LTTHPSADDIPGHMDSSAGRVFRNALREARWALSVWLVFLAWVIGYSWLRGYNATPEPDSALPGTILGMPEWVFWGLALPWVLATALTILFGVFILRDDDLGGTS